VYDAQDLEGHGLSYLSTLPSLTSLTLSGILSLVDGSLEHLGKLKNLKTLDLWCSYTFNSDTEVRYLGDLVNLESLNLTNWPLSDDSLSHFRGLQNLRELTLSGCNCNESFTGSGLFHLQHLTSLRALHIDNADDPLPLSIPQLHLQNLLHLKSLSISLDVEKADNSFQYICQNLPELEHLFVESCSELTDSGAAYILLLTNLRSVVMWDTTLLTDVSLGYIASLKKLEKLHLRGSLQFSDEGAQHHLKDVVRRQNPTLKSLWIYLCPQVSELYTLEQRMRCRNKRQLILKV